MKIYEISTPPETPDQLNITDPDQLNITDPDQLNITDPDQLNITDPKAVQVNNKNWQIAAFSQDAWLLIFHLANAYDWKKDNNNGRLMNTLLRQYRKLVTDVLPKKPMSTWILDASTLAELQLQAIDVEDVKAELLGRVQNVLGITIGPGWVAQKSTPPTKEPYKGFWNKHLSIIGATPVAPKFGSATSDEVAGLTDAEYNEQVGLLDTNVAGGIAEKLRTEIDKFNFGIRGRFFGDDIHESILKNCRLIKSGPQFDQVAAIYKTQTSRGNESNLAIALEDNLDEAAYQKLLTYAKTARWADRLPKGGNKLKNLSDEDPNKILTGKEEVKNHANKLRTEFFKRFPQQAKIAKDSGQGQVLFDSFLISAVKEIQAILDKNDKKITVGEFATIFNKYMQNFIDNSKDLTPVED